MSPSVLSYVPPPRAVPRDALTESELDEIVVEEEHSPPRRNSRRYSRGEGQGRWRREERYVDGDSDLWSRSPSRGPPRGARRY